jgi:hypothetical protein
MSNLSGWMMIYDNGIYRGYNTNGTPYNGGTPIIPSTQGFWVRALGTGASITIPTAQRVHNSQVFYKYSWNPGYPAVSLSSEINGLKDEAKIIFHPEATPGFDGPFDLAKFDNVDEAPTLFTLTDGKPYAVNFYGGEYQDLIIPLGFKTGSDGDYTLTADDISNFSDGISVFLEDLKTHTVINLTESPYYVFGYSTLDNDHRFNLHFKDSWYDTKEPAAPKSFIYANENTIYVNHTGPAAGEVIVYDLAGREVLRKMAEGSSQTQISLPKSKCYYLVKFVSDQMVTTQKVFIE